MMETRVSRPWRLRSDGPFFALAFVSGVIVLYLGRSLTFWYDEWSYITFSGTAVDYLRPHNEHWSTIPLALYRATFDLVGLRSYMPYLGELVVSNLLAVGGAYVLMRRRTGPLVATALAIPLLLLGSGSENLFWAFQIGFVGSVMFGVWAMVVVERPGRWSTVITSALLLASLASTGIGLVFVVAVFGRTVFDRELRVRAVAVVMPAALYVVWFFALGLDAVGQDDFPGLVSLLRFVARGIAYSTGQIIGLSFPDGRLIALVLFGALAVVTARAVAAGRTRALAAGCLLAVTSMYVLAGLVREALGTDNATRSRYVYVAAFLVALAVADWLPDLSARLTPRPRLRLVGVGVIALGVASSVASNVDALADNRAEFQRRADQTRAYVAIALAHRGASWIEGDVSGVMPPIPALLEAVAKDGSPLEDTLVPGNVKPQGPKEYEAALIRIVGDGFRAEPVVGSGDRERLTLVGASVPVVAGSECISLTGTGNDVELTLSARAGARIRVTAPSTIDGFAAIGRDYLPSRFVALGLSPRQPIDVVVPNTGDGKRWRLTLFLEDAAGHVRICGIRLG